MTYTPYYSQWIDAVYDADGNVVTPSPTPGTAASFTAWDTALAQALPQVNKGDLVTYNGTTTTVKPVGTAGTVLTSDPTQADGVAWKPSGSAAGTVNVKDYGAIGDGTNDDTAALTSAIAACPAGGRVFLGPGLYAVSSPLVLPPNITLEGSHGDTIWYTGGSPIPCAIKPTAGFTGTAVIQMFGKADQTPAGTVDHIGTRLRRLTIDGSNLPAGNVRGVMLSGLVREVTLEEVTVRKMTGAGFWCGVGATSGLYPQSLRLRGCLADNNGNNGYTFSNVPDSTIIDCNALGNTNAGFYFAGFVNGQVGNCRAEWSTQQGFYITSGFWANGQGSGGCLFANITTDRSNFNGIYIDATGAGTLQFTNVTLRRDGRNNGTGAGGYAAFNVAATATMPVVVDNLQVYPGVDDNGTGTNSPATGFLTANTAPVMLTSGYVWAATTALSTTPVTTVSPAVGTATGLTTAPTRVAPVQAAPALRLPSVKTANYTLALADAATVIEMNLAGANTVTIPLNSAVAFPIGTWLEVCQVGAGQTTIAATAGVTIDNPGTALTLKARYSTVSLRKRATDEWVISGSVTGN